VAIGMLMENANNPNSPTSAAAGANGAAGGHIGEVKAGARRDSRDLMPESDGREGREGRRGKRKRRPIQPESIPMRKLIPNLMTAGALAAGLASLHFAQDGQFAKAVGCVAVAFVLDGLDGRTARFLKVTSRFGEKFDSIADFTAFGVAPAFLIYQWQLKSTMGATGLAIAVLYILCAAFRLARFTYQARKQTLGAPVGKFFQGLPAPASGAAVLIPVMLELSETVNWRSPYWLTAGYAVMLALFMASTLPMISIKGLRISRSLAKPLMVVAGLITFGLIMDWLLTLSALTGIYLLTFPIGVVLFQRQQAKLAAEAAAGGAGGAVPKP
jgi:CDP-diacylglycerol---serine O-phosphatidyltransferase